MTFIFACIKHTTQTCEHVTYLPELMFLLALVNIYRTSLHNYSFNTTVVYIFMSHNELVLKGNKQFQFPFVCTVLIINCTVSQRKFVTKLLSLCGSLNERRGWWKRCNYAQSLIVTSGWCWITRPEPRYHQTVDPSLWRKMK